MKRIITLIMAVSFLAAFSANADHLSGNLTFSAKMNGEQEVPAVVTNAVGVASLVLNATMDTICIRASVNGLSGPITGAHLHEGALGVVGDVVLDLTSFLSLSGNDISASLSGNQLNAAVITKLLQSEIYINVQTAQNPDGEIRGQITLETDFAFTAMLSGEQEVPAVETPAYGFGIFDVSKNYENMSFKVIVAELSDSITGAHFHMGAPGVVGDVVVDLTSFVNGNVIVGDLDSLGFLADSTFLTDLLAGNIYINVHTVTNPSGEIRGQVITNSNMLAFDARLDGSQEVPPVVTDAMGVASVKLSSTMDTLWYHVIYTGLSGPATGAHFHIGIKGTVGAVVLDATGDSTGNQFVGMFTGSELPKELINQFIKGGIYFNIPTAANPNGEIRGQVYRYAREGYTFPIDASQEVPATSWTATGSGIVTIDRDQENAHVMIVVSGLTGPITGAHFHNNVAGQIGDVIFGFTDWFTMSGTDDAAFGYWTSEDTVPFTTAMSAKFINDSVYVNIYTASFPDGEIRGQVTRGADCFNTAVGIASMEATFTEYSFFPNPAIDYISISLNSVTEMDVKVDLVDLSGKVVSSTMVNLSIGQNNFNFDLKSVDKGMYFLNLNAEGFDSVLGKLIKQ
ncbi:MAG: CHRD domain-containing protein [Chitinophagales bacterium]|nr:CHRD domain-containing protein [Chitinophagales bacterium]